MRSHHGSCFKGNVSDISHHDISTSLVINNKPSLVYSTADGIVFEINGSFQKLWIKPIDESSASVLLSSTSADPDKGITIYSGTADMAKSRYDQLSESILSVACEKESDAMYKGGLCIVTLIAVSFFSFVSYGLFSIQMKLDKPPVAMSTTIDGSGMGVGHLTDGFAIHLQQIDQSSSVQAPTNEVAK